MSASEATISCPICLHDGVFDCAKSLRDRLIHVSTNNVSCPVCQEVVCGLDKLTIHLFTHVKLTTTQKNTAKEENNIIAKKVNFEEENDITILLPKKLKSSVAKNKTLPSTSNGQIKFVKIYPKLPVLSLCNLSVIDFSHESTQKCISSNTNKTLPTFNKEKIQPKSDNMCDLCGLQFFDVVNLKMHRCLVHNIDDNKQQDISSRYHCHLCSKNFKMRGSLMVHLRVAHFGARTQSKSKIKSDTSEENKVNLATENGTNVVETNDNKQWQCDVCRKYFTTKYFLKKHKRLHTGETPYACTQCNKSFTFQQSYHKHLLYHNDEKPHICNFCGRAFKELSTLHNHQRIHTGEKPFSCETCGKCFRQRVSYLVHRRIHTGVMPYKCTACEKSFRYKVSQRTHKCQAQPPGTVVRQSGNLVQKLKQKRLDDDITPTDNFSQFSPNNLTYLEVSEANAELVRTGAKLSLEDTETESFNLIAQAFPNDAEQSNNSCINLESNLNKYNINKNITEDPTNHESSQNIDYSIPSPSDILKNLSLSSDFIIPIKQNRETEDDYDLYSGYNLFLPN